MFGDDSSAPPRHLSPGSYKAGSPFLGPDGKVKLPPEYEWLWPFYQTVSSDWIERIARVTSKILQPYYQFPPLNHTVVDMFQFIRVNLGATQTILTLTVPQSEMARIKFYGTDITPVLPPLPGTEWNEVQWSFLVNGIPLEYYDNFLYQRNILGIPAETTIILKGTDVFTVTARNNSVANNYFCWAFIRGWRWSKVLNDLPDEDLFK